MPRPYEYCILWALIKWGIKTLRYATLLGRANLLQKIPEIVFSRAARTSWYWSWTNNQRAKLTLDMHLDWRSLLLRSNLQKWDSTTVGCRPMMKWFNTTLSHMGAGRLLLMHQAQSLLDPIFCGARNITTSFHEGAITEWLLTYTANTTRRFPGKFMAAIEEVIMENMKGERELRGQIHILWLDGAMSTGDMILIWVSHPTTGFSVSNWVNYWPLPIRACRCLKPALLPAEKYQR